MPRLWMALVLLVAPSSVAVAAPLYPYEPWGSTIEGLGSATRYDGYSHFWSSQLNFGYVIPTHPDGSTMWVSYSDQHFSLRMAFSPYDPKYGFPTAGGIQHMGIDQDISFIQVDGVINGTRDGATRTGKLDITLTDVYFQNLPPELNAIAAGTSHFVPRFDFNNMNRFFVNLDIVPNPVPEPLTITTWGVLGVAAIVVDRRRSRSVRRSA
ncbi:hypothetical protein [Singulisphaera sp. PoT]|uniref:hypothetical protein n=1 Tax=Singulisphaera sp. PoT TaxID=3411797 RepID=UPI003BF54608